MSKDRSRGQATLTSVMDSDAPNAYEPKVWTKLIPSWRSSRSEIDESEPLDLVLQVVRTTQEVDGPTAFPPNANYDLCAGFLGRPSGVIRLTLDAHRVIYADLRNGRFSLGAWSTVSVDCALWGLGAQLDTFDVHAWLQPAGDGEWLRYTMPVEYGDSYSDFPCPPGAQFVDLLAAMQEFSGSEDTDPIPQVHWGDPNAPRYLISGRAESAVHDYQAQTFTPAHRPLNLRATSSDAPYASNSVRVTKEGTGADIRLQLVYYVR
jgi:hypothetical protein